MGINPRLDKSPMKISLLWKLLAVCIIVQSLGVCAKQLNSNADLIFDEINEDPQELEQRRTNKNKRQVENSNNDDLDHINIFEDQLQLVGDYDDEGWLSKGVKRVQRDLHNLISGSDQSSKTKRAVQNKRAASLKHKRANKAQRAFLAARPKRQEDYEENDTEFSGDGNNYDEVDNDSENEISYHQLMFIVNEMWSDNLRRKESNEFMELHRNLEVGFRKLFDSVASDEDNIKSTLIYVSKTNDPFKVHVTVQFEISGTKGEEFENIIQRQIQDYSKIGDVGAEYDDNFSYRTISDIENPPPLNDHVYTVRITETTPQPWTPTQPSGSYEPYDPEDNDNNEPEYNQPSYSGTDTRPEYPVDSYPEQGTPSPSSASPSPYEPSPSENDCKTNPNGEFRCGDGVIINCEQVCDHVVDCDDRSDEQSCPSADVKCSENEFMCDNMCMDLRYKCNGDVNCRDGTDEKDCKKECFQNEFQCRSGDCIPGNKRCDGVPNCPNEDDEEQCYNTDAPQMMTPTPTPTPTVTRTNHWYSRSRPNQNTTKPPPYKTNSRKYSRLGHHVPSVQYQQSGECDNHNQFKCVQTGVCIPIALRCDRTIHCNDYSDEEGCGNYRVTTPIPRTKTTTTILPILKTTTEGATKYQHHILNSSRANGNCLSFQYQCAIGNCILSYKRCNGITDCPDGSDEFNCQDTQNNYDYKDENYDTFDMDTTHCELYEFECDQAQCVPIEKRCDGYPDCDDETDESNCPPLAAHESVDDCSIDEFFCDDRCHPNSIRCNGKMDCLDQTDEKNCNSNESYPGAGGSSGSNYPSNQYPCNELVCPGANKKCYKFSEKCDGITDCDDGSDEQNCCKPNEFSCRTGQCVPESAKCNGSNDCYDGSDEADCREPERNCLPYQFRCSNGQCISQYARCNGQSDCNDGSDERNCPFTPANPQLNLKTYPDSQIIKESREVIFRCRDEGPLRAKVKWSRPGGRPLPSGFLDKNGRLEIPNIRIEDSGQYICEAVGYPPHIQGQSVQVHLTVERYNPIADRPPTACNENQATCMNGECIDKHNICDGIQHCSDGSDEHSCSRDRKCHPNQFLCKNSKCVDRIWRCDGENDCGDNSDEDSCDAEPSGSPCRYDEFQCRSGHCIPKSFHCDDTNDCKDGSDEIGCTAPAVIRPPPSLQNIPVGGVLNITCRAAGVPVPVIVWRLNWGHVPEKCESKSYAGTGTLFCPNMEVKDSGAYSCEIINSKGTLFVTPDTLVTVQDGRPNQDVCPSGFFNALARRQDECINCFCFGVSKTCKSADLFTYSLQPPITSQRVIGVEIRPYQDVQISELSGSNTILLRHGVQFRASDVGYSRQMPYLALPQEYLGGQLRSYGGFLKYDVFYQGQGRPTDAPDVIITGNGFTLVYRSRSQPEPNVNNVMSVPISAGNWMKPDGRRATREEVMMILANIENILIRLSYIDSSEREVELKNINMDSAAVNDRGLGSASLVEQCSCPPGYAGDSCERCAIDFVRQPGGPWLGRCVPQEVERKCPHGTFGDLRQGIPCKPCPCPLTNPSNNFANGCYIGSDGEAICNCNQGYTGRRCEECAEGYEGDPLHPTGSCYPRPENDCNAEGTLNARPDGSCECKSHVTGARCDQCKASSFFLNSFTYTGCIECFCMGISKECSSSSWYRNSVSTNFGRSQVPHGFNLISGYDSVQPIPVQFSQSNSQLTFGRSEQNDVLYWSLPADFLGDKITAYGGNLNYTLSYSPLPGGQISRNVAPDVVIKSLNDISIHHFRKSPVNPSVSQTYSIPILESSWQRSDGINVNREHLLMALADIQAIYIKATYTTVTKDGTLTFVSLDTAEPTNHGTSRAYEVEECRCPPGHTGLSCEDCAPGYKRMVDSGLYLGLCEPCECNGHSSECHPETGVCMNCRDNTAGETCNECAPGFVGNATNGSPRDCQPTGDNQGLCDQCNSDGTYLCNGGYCQCKPNVEGQFCDQCRPGTFGLSASKTDGCSECFCSGASNQCYAGNFYKQLIPIPFIEKGPTITDENGDLLDSGNMRFDLEQNMFNYSTPSYTQKYWSLPSVNGDRLKSYGGLLSFVLRVQSYGNYEPGKDVIIIGNGNKLVWTRGQDAMDDEEFQVRLHEEDNWTRYDGVRASRNDVMTVLSNLEYILIRATPKIPTQTTSIGNVILESASEVSTEVNAPLVTDIEVCQCPAGYSGTSCQTCAPMYYRDTSDSSSSTGACVQCPCSEGAESCSNTDLGYVQCRCRPGYSGDRCQYSRSDPGSAIQTTTKPPPIYETEITVSISAPEISIVPIGGSVTLFCSGMFTVNRVPVVVNWYKLNGRLPYQAQQDSGTLYLRDLQIQDSGVYICQARGASKMFEDRVSVTVSPRTQESAPVINMDTPYVTVDEYRPLDVDCSVTGNPKPIVTWTRVGGPLSRDARFDGDRLVISSIRKSDEGSYRCSAQNSVGATERNIAIYVNAAPQATPRPIPPPEREIIYIDPPQVQEYVGNTVRLSCQPRVQIRLVYSWTKDGSPAGWNSNMEFSGNEIIINDIKMRDSGRYTCTGIDTQARRNYTANAYVVVEERPDSGVGGGDVGYPSGSPPTVRPLQKEHVIAQGEDLTITCEASGSPYPAIRWTKVHSSFESNIQQSGNVLRIMNAQPANRGVFLCVAENSLGTDQADTIIDIEPRERPAIELYPSGTQTIMVGSNVSISCNFISGVPTPKLSWQRVGGLSMPPSFIEEYPGTGIITNIKFYDAGEYECVAENVVGRVTAVTNLIVHDPPRITLDTQSETIVLTEGDDLKIVCSASGSPTPSVQWIDEGTAAVLARATPFFANLGGQAVLEVYHVTMNDAKIYTCQATNDAGTDVKYVTVDVQRKRGDIGFSDVDQNSGNRPYYPQPQPQPQPANAIYNAEIGESATLSCDISNAQHLETRWERVDGLPLPKSAYLNKNNLIITRVEPDAFGQYKCNAYDGDRIVTFIVAELALLPIPHITLRPKMPLTVRANDNVEINCDVTGAQPMNVVWYADNNRPLPPSVQVNGPYLRFNSITPADAGRYYCSVTNTYGNATEVAEVLVDRGNAVEQPSNTRYDINEGEDAVLSCDIRSRSREPIRPDTQVIWRRSDGRPLPRNSRQRERNLYLWSVRPEDQGRYVCELYSSSGASAEPSYVDLVVKTAAPQLPQWATGDNKVYENAPVLKLDQQSSILGIGESTEVECYPSDYSLTEVVWEREDGSPLPLNIKQVGNKLIISNADHADAGVYVCRSKTNEGDLYTTSYKLEIAKPSKKRPKQPRIEYADVGSRLKLNCDAPSDATAFRWSRQYASMQSGKDLYSRELCLDNVQARDAGTYVCSATQNGESTDYPVILVVTGAIPHFHQAPLSYMSFPSLPSSSFKFNFEITFRPKQPNGLLLFNGQKKGSGDYIALSLNDRYPEFRFDFDGKPVVLRSEQPITLGDWHTVRVNRYRRDGYMTVDNQHPVGFPLLQNVSPLDLVEDLYIGAVPRWEDLPAGSINDQTGFVGCISRLTLQDQIIELYKDAKHKEGITSCEPCADDPCQNEGICLESQTETGYTCICQEGFTGSNCAIMGTSCTPGICGTGRCEDTEMGMECYCALNKTGDRCQYIEHLNEASIAFRGNSFAAYQTPRASKLGIRFSVRPDNLDDAILLYIAESKLVSGDFIAVVLHDKHVELRINTAARLRPVIIRSVNPLQLNKWTEIEISRRFGEGILRVGDEPEQKAKASGLARTLHIKTPLYIGGYDHQITLNRDVNITHGFVGCVSNLFESNRKINLIAEIKDAANIQNCGEINEVEPPSGSGYEADEIEDDPCRRDPCENGGTCVSEDGKVQCNCPLGFSGKNCENHVVIERNANFRGNGYLELDRTIFGEEIDHKSSFVAIVFSTMDPNGLLLWWGQKKSEEYNNQDFMALAVVDGIMEFAFRLDGEESTIRSTFTKVDDGKRHIVILKRDENQASLELNHIVQAGETRPTGKIVMTLPGNMFIGGAPDIVKFTGNRYRNGFNGCVHVVEAEKTIQLSDAAISAVNLDTCPDDDEDGTEPPVV